MCLKILQQKTDLAICINPFCKKTFRKWKKGVRTSRTITARKCCDITCCTKCSKEWKKIPLEIRSIIKIISINKKLLIKTTKNKDFRTILLEEIIFNAETFNNSKNIENRRGKQC